MVGDGDKLSAKVSREGHRLRPMYPRVKRVKHRTKTLTFLRFHRSEPPLLPSPKPDRFHRRPVMEALRLVEIDIKGIGGDETFCAAKKPRNKRRRLATFQKEIVLSSALLVSAYCPLFILPFLFAFNRPYACVCVCVCGQPSIPRSSTRVCSSECDTGALEDTKKVR